MASFAKTSMSNSTSGSRGRMFLATCRTDKELREVLAFRRPWRGQKDQVAGPHLADCPCNVRYSGIAGADADELDFQPIPRLKRAFGRQYRPPATPRPPQVAHPV